jgi:hypothetical protein
LTKYEPDWINGRRVPPFVVAEDQVLAGTHSGTVHVESGHLELRGTLRGTLVLHPGARATVHGTQAGTVHVGRGATMVVHGALNGETQLERGASLVVEATGRLAGGLVNDGRVVVRGVFGGARSGDGIFALEGEGRIKEPRLIDGVPTYVWRDRE